MEAYSQPDLRVCNGEQSTTLGVVLGSVLRSILGNAPGSVELSKFGSMQMNIRRSIQSSKQLQAWEHTNTIEHSIEGTCESSLQ